ncbi:anti-sigma regulatory factor [candidate division KSB1 bacterium]|nr:MAG: anti-sigma regulatory factor [candidate division KSB1 bacterium]
MNNNSVLFEEDFKIKGWDFTNAGEASLKIKNYLKEVGIAENILKRVAITSYEAEMNIVLYAKEGTINFKVTPKKVLLEVKDRGPGIEDVELAMKEGYSTATEEIRNMGFGAGMGLPNIKKNADMFVIKSEPGKGTKLNIEVYLK